MGAMGIRLATWNVNSLRQRLDHLARFTAEAAPDVICLQETKVTDAAFPRAALRTMGYPQLPIDGLWPAPCRHDGSRSTSIQPSRQGGYAW